uniref:Calx-beta domain-containing protein n=1 Tax=Amphimedon queenslandica TaxID=400682 RepID=A0A1X7TSN7_AMPQE
MESAFPLLTAVIELVEDMPDILHLQEYGSQPCAVLYVLVSLLAGCFATIIGFDHSLLHFVLRDAGRVASLTADELYRSPGVALLSIKNVSINIETRSLPNNIDDYFVSFIKQATINSTELPYAVQLEVTRGNGIALQPSISFSYVMSLNPNSRLPPAGQGADVKLNYSFPEFSYNSNNKLNDITFYPVTSLVDNVIEGNELIQVVLLPGPNSANIQFIPALQTATITIFDKTNSPTTLSIERRSYSVIESEGSLEICVVLTGDILSSSVNISVLDSQGTAKRNSDYTFNSNTLTLPAFENKSCTSLYIINDNLWEPSYESFTLSISRVTPENSNFILDNTPSTIQIQDDDIKQQLTEDVIVQCYTSATNCNSNTNGVSLAAIDCCNRTGGGYISHSSLAAAQQCGACVVVGFDQTRVHIGPSDAGRRYSFTADVLLSTPGAPDVTGLDYTISREPVTLVDVADYLSSDFSGLTNGFLPERFRIQYVSQGNDVALQPTLSFDYWVTAETDAAAGDPPIPSGVVLVYRCLSIIIDDIDIITVGLIGSCTCFPPLLEGRDGVVGIAGPAFTYEAPFEVTVSLERYTGPLSQDESAVGDFDLFNFTDRRSVVFLPTVYHFNQRVERVTFFMPQDNIVELQEVFQLRLSVNDSRVRLDPYQTTRVVRLNNQDVFSVGFRELQVTIREGEVATLFIKQIGNETSGAVIGGFPEGRLTPVRLRYIFGTATGGSDFSLNSSIPRFTYSVNNRLNDITFTPITSIDDNIIEGNETIRIIILRGSDNVVQILKDRQTATITIIDDDIGMLSLERGTYDVIENEGSVEICAVLTGGVLSTDTVITIQARDSTAQLWSDYSTRRIRPILHSSTIKTCDRFNIMNDVIREPLFENFTVLITSVFPENSGLTVNGSPSFIRIRDDDQ